MNYPSTLWSWDVNEMGLAQDSGYQAADQLFATFDRMWLEWQKCSIWKLWFATCAKSHCTLRGAYKKAFWVWLILKLLVIIYLFSKCQHIDYAECSLFLRKA